jgi:hypothetical protein
MITRLVFLVTLILAGSAIVLDAQTRRTVGSTREDQHPASSSPSSSRGEQRTPDPPSPPPSPPPPANPGPVLPPRPPVIVYPTPGIPIEGTAPLIIVQPVLAPITVTKEATPMWPVIGTEILDRLTDPDNGGYDFEDGEVVAFDDDGADVYYESEGSLLRVADDSDIQDLGPAKSAREDLRVNRDGWEVRKAITVQQGHQYAMWRWNGDVVRLYVQEVLDDAIVFDWMPGRTIERTGVKGPIFGR